ncbi:polysaccharide deacetylase family protein [Clostridium tyrobutyricum]|jgi:peptidoglycan/xylan/chitin deacetylase (PgdA/CDA1 family)|uniref:Peptidoglycan N-acetylglucosamine deacetylase n=1 Tax=Clostridium tyrobutyricum DIVETGP TaxID=1408889 RepID=W6N4P5_CLOTY|nr:polysaccharide deacetylase family protein [Clostridium tyrobutyricum]AND84460.1 putative polysaccharide deacetylase [Clostridium tyrobutyricum]ANP69075.1 polysaccharide deacetylase [Clostridium tyrobutyricum]MBV4425908.1 polysaccharide deacetylase [Clostridium tyrobutyricum]MBV4435057.1 polysaccharide deacetylase [Clostridium tyrobutyricum]MBV4441292.1 polysaccharide deacetylase [Clostridium tyrobutyricum]
MRLKNIAWYFVISLLTISILFSPIKVMAKNNPSKLIYLTFDDGPSETVTNNILDILKHENIKATFFVIGYKFEGREDVLKRIKEEGHSIGLHTFTHDYKKIYANEASFIDEMNKSGVELKNIIGFSPKIIRFPSGSKDHLNPNLLDKLHSCGYKIFDWNLCLSDGINYNTPVNKLYTEGTKKCINPNKIFLLAHCSGENKNTCEALPKIIKHYKELGYEFRTITEKTPEYHFKISR